MEDLKDFCEENKISCFTCAKRKDVRYGSSLPVWSCVNLFASGSYDGSSVECTTVGFCKEYEPSLVHHCDNCTKCLADCDGDPVFGNGFGNDNVTQCEEFISKG